MRQDTIQKAIGEITSIYKDKTYEARDNGDIFLRIDDVELYAGCQPEQTSFLFVFNTSLEKPRFYVSPNQTLKNGARPKNSSVVNVGGQAWMQFSFNIPWTEGDSFLRFFSAVRQRFSQNE